ncbi:alpha/beta fold hydrolase [Dyella telluris]|uniref:Alpha/beta hydrolase n=1 Tax=Dyella telluris TaxID=2763498 RepID=A0A7G8Q3H0_9GAMM|nr:alpha/beta hydrolase [Dyella telluris]QNK01328.1 alpha/beta hydrolase [Dyella telluris]
MRRYLILAAGLLGISGLVHAGVPSYPKAFHDQLIQTNGTHLYVRVGGHGPAVLMLHGFGDTGDMWQPAAVALMKDHTVIVPDLRGLGLSDPAPDGYTKKNQGQDIADLLDQLHVDQVALVSHDIGNMVAYAFVVQHPSRVTRWVAIDAPLPGIGDWDAQLRSPRTWHFNFHGPDEERLVAGRERIYLDRFWNELSANPANIDEATRKHYATLYARPHAIHDAFAQFAAFPQDAIDNQALLSSHGKLAIPVLALGAEKSYGTRMAENLRNVATDVTAGVIAGSGHWVMEEQPARTTALIDQFVREP